jgi:hypothetical protein
MALAKAKLSMPERALNHQLADFSVCGLHVCQLA